jgi:hypothetical protein
MHFKIFPVCLPGRPDNLDFLQRMFSPPACPPADLWHEFFFIQEKEQIWII